MTFPRSRKKQNLLPGRNFTVRTHRNLGTLISQVRPGDLAVIDQLDLDAESARALVDRRPGAVLNAAEFISGRYANLGPQVLVGAGIPIFQGRRDQVLALRDDTTVRLHEGTLYDGAVVLLDLTEVTQADVRDRMDAARSGLAVQLESFAHSASELVHREEGLLLHGAGFPQLRTKIAGKVVVVVGPGARPADLKRLRHFLRDARPVLVGVDSGTDVLAARGLRADLAVLSGGPAVSDKALRRCREAVVTEPGRAVAAQVEKLNLPVHQVPTSTAPVDLALLLARQAGARLAVPVGTPATLEEFIDRDRNDQASNVLTRLRLGSRVVEGTTAATVLATRRRRFGAVLLVAAVAIAAVGVLGFTTTGQHWRDDVADRLPDGWVGASSLQKEKDRVAARDEQVAALQERLKAAGTYVDATAASAVRGTLTGRAVALVQLPGADSSQVAQVRTLLATAGATVTAEATVRPAASESSQGGLVDALTSQILTQATDVHVPSGSDGVQRLGALLARATGVPSSAHVQQAAYDARAVSIASGLQSGGLVTAKVTARAALTLIVGGPGQDGADTLASFATAYATQVPTVVAGDATGVVATLRAGGSKAFSTVDGFDATTGRVAAVLALAARTHGHTGSFGPTGTTGVVPAP